jgi:DNA-directed RNA polymerase subunit omega
MTSAKIIPFDEGGARSEPGRRTDLSMRSDLVQQAQLVYPDPPLLINIVSKRVRQLNQGRSPLVPTTPSMGMADVALMEIIAGKIAVDREGEAPAE